MAREPCALSDSKSWPALASSESLWEMPIWEAVWPYWDPMDSVCLRTASVEWNVAGKYGPHGELFFFLIQKEPASMPGSETFSPLLNADIRTSFSSADVLKKCALIALHLIAAEGRGGEDGCHSPDLEGTNGSWAAQRVQCGRVKAKLGQRTKACLQVTLGKAMCATNRCMSLGCMGLVARSLFLKDWELAKVALTCHMALDMPGNARGLVG